MSQITITQVGGPDAGEWNALVERSSQATPFHRYESLETFAEHSDTRADLLVGKKGGNPVGIFPVFTYSYPFVSAALSPPPNLKIPYLGPALIGDGERKRSSRERRRWRFVRRCLDHIRSAIGPEYVRFRTSPRYRDPRPFVWEGFDADSRFTYVVDLGQEDLFKRFSSDARSNVRDCEDAGCEITVGDAESIRKILAQVRTRHEEQGLSYPIDASFIESLYERLPSGALRPYVCKLDGEFVGGNIILTDDDAAYAWVGAATPDIDLSVNDAIHWRAMRDNIERGAERYDLLGANKKGLSEYKAKFAPTLEPYQRIRKNAQYVGLAESVYQRVRRTSEKIS